MSRARVRSLGRALEAIRRRLNPARPLVVVASVPEHATDAEVDPILDAAQAEAEALDPYEGPHPRPVLRIALQTPDGWEPDRLPDDEPANPAESEKP